MSARILVVDDEEDIRRLFATVLRRRGYTVVEAADGETALALVGQEAPDLVMLDVAMPGMSGVAVAVALAADPATAHIPIIIVSASGQRRQVEKGLASGAYAYLVKPVELPDLLARVAEALDQQGRLPTKWQQESPP